MYIPLGNLAVTVAIVNSNFKAMIIMLLIILVFVVILTMIRSVTLATAYPNTDLVAAQVLFAQVISC